MRRGSHRVLRQLVVVSIALLGPLFAVSTRADEEPIESGYDKTWGYARLYEGNADTFFQSFALSGRLQLDFAYVDNEDEDHGEFNVRRFRFGFKTVFQRDFTLHIEGDFNPQEADPFYERLTDAYLAWAPSKAVKLTAGKHSAGFTLDGLTSSKSLLTVERNNLTNNIWFTEEYIPGVSLRGESGNFQYVGGLFSSGPQTPEFGDYSGGEFYLLNLGYDFAQVLGADDGLLRLNLIHNDPDPNNSFTRDLDRIVSLNFSYLNGAWGFRTDVAAARGYFDQPDLAAFVLMPFYDLTDRWQLVARYTWVESDGDNGVRLARYETSIERGRGDLYQEAHFGFSYYWFGHKLKLQNGLQYVDMRDEAEDGGEYRGWSWTTGFRISW